MKKQFTVARNKAITQPTEEKGKGKGKGKGRTKKEANHKRLK